MWIQSHFSKELCGSSHFKVRNPKSPCYDLSIQLQSRFLRAEIASQAKHGRVAIFLLGICF